jgi:hypothetical protein
MNDTRTSVLSEAIDALHAKAQELSDRAENEMRRDLEEQAQVWHEAAELVRKLGQCFAPAEQGAQDG